MNAADFLARQPIPIIQAPMLGASSFGMALAVSAAGGLGSIASAGSSPEEIVADAARMRTATDAPFAMNLFVLGKAAPDVGEVTAAIARLAPWRAELGLAEPSAPNDFAPDFEAQFAGLIRAAPPVASFAFDILSVAQVAALHAVGTLVFGTATTVAEARAWEAAGADAVVLQGFEAGGHRGHFLAPVERSLVGTLALVRAARNAVALPLIAAGGIMDGAGVAAALALGASAAQMGTAFLLADETAISPAWRDAVAHVGDDATALTRAFSGRHARGIENRFMREMRPVENEVPAYPVQNRLTKELRAAAAKAGEADMLSLWAGQAATLAREGASGDLVRQWWAEAKAAGAALGERLRG
jgi:nitronate monooxygenase